MPQRAAIINQGNLLIELLSGTVTATDISQWMRENAALPGFRASIHQLVIVDTTVSMNISAEETRQFAVMTPRFSKTSCRAYYVGDNDLVYGTLRMYEQERSDSSGHICIFKDLDEACGMVGIKPTAIYALWPDIKGLI